MMYYILIDTHSYSNYIKYVLVILYSISTYLQTAIPLFSNTRAQLRMEKIP